MNTLEKLGIEHLVELLKEVEEALNGVNETEISASEAEKDCYWGIATKSLTKAIQLLTQSLNDG